MMGESTLNDYARITEDRLKRKFKDAVPPNTWGQHDLALPTGTLASVIVAQKELENRIAILEHDHNGLHSWRRKIEDEIGRIHHTLDPLSEQAGRIQAKVDAAVELALKVLQDQIDEIWEEMSDEAQ